MVDPGSVAGENNGQELPMIDRAKGITNRANCFSIVEIRNRGTFLRMRTYEVDTESREILLNEYGMLGLIWRKTAPFWYKYEI